MNTGAKWFLGILTGAAVIIGAWFVTMAGATGGGHWY